MAKHKVLSENHDHFVVQTEGKGAPYKVAKVGLSPEMHDTIRGYADGGVVAPAFDPNIDQRDPNAWAEDNTRKGAPVVVPITPAAPVAAAPAPVVVPLPPPPVALRMPSPVPPVPAAGTELGKPVEARPAPTPEDLPADAATQADTPVTDGQAVQDVNAAAALKRAQVEATLLSETKKVADLGVAAEKTRQNLTEGTFNQRTAYQDNLIKKYQEQHIDPHEFWDGKIVRDPVTGEPVKDESGNVKREGGRTVGQKVMIGIGMFLTGLGGKDPFAPLNAAVERNIASQKADIDNRNNQLARYMEETRSLPAAEAAMRADSWTTIGHQIDALGASAKSDEVKANAAAGALQAKQNAQTATNQLSQLTATTANLPTKLAQESAQRAMLIKGAQQALESGNLELAQKFTDLLVSMGATGQDTNKIQPPPAFPTTGSGTGPNPYIQPNPFGAPASNPADPNQPGSLKVNPDGSKTQIPSEFGGTYYNDAQMKAILGSPNPRVKAMAVNMVKMPDGTQAVLSPGADAKEVKDRIETLYQYTKAIADAEKFMADPTKGGSIGTYPDFVTDKVGDSAASKEGREIHSRLISLNKRVQGLTGQMTGGIQALDEAQLPQLHGQLNWSDKHALQMLHENAANVSRGFFKTNINHNIPDTFDIFKYTGGIRQPDKKEATNPGTFVRSR